MARTTSGGNLSGKLGDKVYYVRKSKQCVRYFKVNQKTI